jgi:hypothetical protein
MGFVMAVGSCFACRRPFGFNPHRVPSVPIGADGSIQAGGDRKPICRTCAVRVNEARRAGGLPVWDVSDEVYGPIEEAEL